MIYKILEELRKGNILPLDANRIFINQQALSLLNTNDLNADQINILSALLNICNIAYNNTTIYPLPIEDGVYDTLLEKYRKYNPNFQVGSEIINFDDVTINDALESDRRNPIHAITIHDKDIINRSMFINDITNIQMPSRNDFLLSSAISFSTSSISKRTHITQHEHPELVGTLDKAKIVLTSTAIDLGVENDTNMRILERDFFLDHIRRGVIDPNKEYTMVLELKYDGISIEADCCNMILSARTRGDTNIGMASDITPILQGYKLPNYTFTDLTMGVKFEAIMTYSDLSRYNFLRNKSYVNARYAIIGLFGANDAPKYKDYITLVPLQIDQKELGMKMNRVEEIEFMNKYLVSKGCPLRYTIIKGDYRSLLFQIKTFVEEMEHARSIIPFMYDGIVISYLDEEIRKTLGRENYINKYSIAVKFNPLRVETIFNGYMYTVGQDGSITPMIYYDPVSFFGTTHNHSSGHSYARFQELSLAPGDIITVEYIDDVMPYVSKPDINHNKREGRYIIPFVTECPSCGSILQLSKSKKTMICINPECKGKKLARLTNMMAKLNLKDFGEERINMIMQNNNIEHFYQILELTENDVKFLGEINAKKFEDRVNSIKTNSIYDYELIGSIGFTGIALRMSALIMSNFTISELLCMFQNNTLIENLISIKGIGRILAEKINNEMHYFIDDLRYIESMPNVKPFKGQSLGLSIRCSGFRDPELMNYLTSLGYDADDNASVTKNTNILLIPYVGYVSSKVKNAGPNTTIIPVQQFKNNIQYYTNINI